MWFNRQVKLSMKKEDFLLHKGNKQHFLEMLTEMMNESSLSAIQASGDAYQLIVSTPLWTYPRHTLLRLLVKIQTC